MNRVCQVAGMFLCRFAGGVPPFLTVWGGQTERETPLCNIKLHAARFGVCVGLAADRRVSAAVIKQTLFQVGVVGTDMKMSRTVQSNLPKDFGKRVSGENHFLKGSLLTD